MAELPASIRPGLPAANDEDELGPLYPPNPLPKVIDAKFKRVRRSDAEWAVLVSRAQLATGLVLLIPGLWVLYIFLAWAAPYLGRFNWAVLHAVGFRN